MASLHRVNWGADRWSEEIIEGHAERMKHLNMVQDTYIHIAETAAALNVAPTLCLNCKHPWCVCIHMSNPTDVLSFKSMHQSAAALRRLASEIRQKKKSTFFFQNHLHRVCTLKAFCVLKLFADKLPLSAHHEHVAFTSLVTILNPWSMLWNNSYLVRCRQQNYQKRLQFGLSMLLSIVTDVM